MLGTGLASARIAGQSEPRCHRSRESMVLTWVLFGAVQATQAFGGEQPPTDSALGAGSKNSRDARAGTSLPSVFMSPTFISRTFTSPVFAPPAFAPLQSPAADIYSATEFRPHGGFDKLGTARTQGPIIDAPMLQDTSLWQQLAEYRTQNRVRLLTLWQIRGSSISLQAGKRGVPSLQWSTSLVRQEGVASGGGLFDHLLPSRHGSGNSRGTAPRPATVTAPSRFPD